MRIAVGGMGTESCTFSPLPTRLEDFTIKHGSEILDSREYPFLAQYKGAVDFVATLSARALPGGSV